MAENATPASEDTGSGYMSAVLSVVRHTAGLAGYFARTFVLSHLIIDFVVGFLLAVVSFWIAYDGSLLRGTVAALLAFVLSVVAGFVLGTKTAAFYTTSRAIQKAGLADVVFTALFERVLGVTEDKPEGDLAVVQALHGISLPEAQERLNQAAADLLAHPIIDKAVPRFARWIAARIQRLAVWALVRVIVAQWIDVGEDGQIDLLDVRNQLAGHVDVMIANELRQSVWKVVLIGIGGLTLVTCLLAWGIRQLPI